MRMVKPLVEGGPEKGSSIKVSQLRASNVLSTSSVAIWHGRLGQDGVAKVTVITL